MKNLIQFILFSLMSVSLLTLPISKAVAKDSMIEFVPAETPYFVHYKLNEYVTSFLPKEIPLSEETSEDFMTRLLQDLVRHYNSKNLKALGLNEVTEMEFMLYGLGLWPVATLTLDDSKKFTRWIAKLAKATKTKLTQNGRFLVLSSDRNPNVTLTLNFVKHWVNIAVVPQVYASQMLKILGDTQAFPSNLKNSGQIEAWKQEIKSGQSGLAFVSFEKLTQILLKRGKGFNRSFAWLDDRPTQLVPPSCVDDYLSLIQSFPYMIAGFHVVDSMHSEGQVLFKFSSALAQVTQNFTPKEAYKLKQKDELMSLSLGLNIKGIIDGIRTFVQARLEQPYTCPHLAQGMLAPEKLQMLSSQLMMIPPFIYDVQGISFSLNQVQPEPEAMAVIHAKNISSLLTILKSMVPQLANLVLPKVDAKPQVLSGLPLPPKLAVKAEMKADAFGLSIGSNQTNKLSALLASGAKKSNTLLYISYNMQRLFKLMSNSITSLQTFQQKSKEASYRIEVEQAKANGMPIPKKPSFKTAPNPLDFLGNIYSGQLVMKLGFNDQGLYMAVKQQSEK